MLEYHNIISVGPFTSLYANHARAILYSTCIFIYLFKITSKVIRSEFLNAEFEVIMHSRTV